MKYKVFTVRLVNLFLIAGILLGYQGVLVYRAQAEEIAYLKTQLAFTETAEDADGAGGSYIDGVYTGEADGFGGPVAVEVTVSQGSIMEIQIISAEKEDGAYLDMAKDVIEEMKQQQGTDVDVVSGATFSSNGIINAAAAALEGAVQ